VTSPKVQAIRDAAGTLTGWVFFCPACGFHHKFSTEWTFNCDLERPTFSPSLVVRYPIDGAGKVCHLTVTDGVIKFLPDCTHAMAGQDSLMVDIHSV